MSTQNIPKTGNETPVATQAKQKAAELAEQTKSAASGVVKDATRSAAMQADAAKTSVADEMSGVASALRTAAEEMRSGSPQERTFGQIAEGIADASDAMREKDLSTMVHDVSAFARKNPLVFLGGAALIGFAATRFAKATGEATVDQTVDQQDTSYASPYATTPGDYS